MTVATATATRPETPNGGDAGTVLSICIPTYNRARFLDYLFGQIRAAGRFAFSFEIVVSDNASSDDTAAVVERHRAEGLPIAYHRQEFNKGSLANLTNAFRRARGRYVLYLADDDLLVPDALADTVRFLQEHPEVRAAYAPWEVYDDVLKVTTETFYSLEADQVFRPGQELDVLQLLIERHIFPEIAIYRRDAISDVMMDARFCFWAFTYLGHVLAKGPIAFLQRPFYRSVSQSSVVPDRQQAGFEQAMTDWDNYRGGLEYFVYLLMRRSGRQLTVEARRQFRDAVDGFIATRMRVAMRLWFARNDFVRVYELACRLHHLDPREIAAVPRIQDLPIFLAAQTLSRLANSIAGLTRIILLGAADPASLEALLREVGLDDRIAVTTPSDIPLDELQAESLVFIVDEGDRAKFLALGYEPGLILSEADLMSGIHLG